MPALIADLSNYQAGVSFDALAATGVQGVIIKATQGTYYRSPAMAGQVAAARAKGWPVGLYGFLDNEDGGAQADYFLNTCEALMRPGDLPPMADFERSDSNPTHAQLHQWTQRLADRGHPQQMIYTGSYWDTAGDAHCTYCAQYYLLLAHYWDDRRPTPLPRAKAPWAAWTAWQFTDRMPVAGTGGVDCSLVPDLSVLTGTTTQEDPLFTAASQAQLDEVLKRLQTLPGDLWATPITYGPVTAQPAAAVLATAMTGALGAAAGTDPQGIADHLASTLGPDLAAQVLQALSAKLATK